MDLLPSCTAWVCLTVVHVAAFAVYCQSVASWRQSADLLAEMAD